MDEAPVLSAARSWVAWSKDNDRLLAALSWAGRLVVLAVVALTSLTHPAEHTRDYVNEVVAFSLGAIAATLWAATERSVRVKASLGRFVPYVVGATGIFSGWSSTASNGGGFSLLGSMAVVWAGFSLSLAGAWAVAAASALAVVFAGLGYGASTWGFLGYPLVVGISLLFGRVIRAYRLGAEQSAALLAQSEQLRQEQARAATLDERNRIAREIHDVLAHSLGALAVQVQAAKAVLTDQGDLQRAVELLNQAQRMVSEGLSETRRAVWALRTDTPPLPTVLAELSASHQHRHRAAVSFRVSGSPRPLSPDAGLALTRTAQEALVNTAKHAPHQPVEVCLDYLGDRTTLTVANLVCGIGAAPGFETLNSGHGLSGMSERLALIDGSLTAGPHDGHWVVAAQVPQ